MKFGDKTTPSIVVLEHCTQNIGTAINNKSLSGPQIVSSIYQIAEGMKYVHFHKIIHRDLKPSNILIADDNVIKICDFGISKLMTAEEQTKTRGIGTQKFMAPEIINEDIDYNEKVDVYSFGVLVFFILNNGDLSTIKIGDIFKGKKIKIPDEFAPFAKQLISNCWKLNPEKRPSFKNILESMKINQYQLVPLLNKEIKQVCMLVKQHKAKIPYYHSPSH